MEAPSFSMAISPETTAAGMRALPYWPGVRPLTTEGAGPFDLSHITHFQIYMKSPRKPQRLIIDNVRLLPAIDFRGIIDRYGQYTRDDWPGKLKQENEFAERKTAEDAQLAAEPALPDRDIYGGLVCGSRAGRQRIFSHRESAKSLGAGHA